MLKQHADSSFEKKHQLIKFSQKKKPNDRRLLRTGAKTKIILRAYYEATDYKV